MSDSKNGAAKKFKVKRLGRSGVVHEHIVTVDAEDAHLLRSNYWLAQFCRDEKGEERVYIIRSTLSGEGQKLPLHKVILGAGMQEKIYHINGDTLDNRKANLFRSSERIEEIK